MRGRRGRKNGRTAENSASDGQADADVFMEGLGLKV